jgi:hypothetical protein
MPKKASAKGFMAIGFEEVLLLPLKGDVGRAFLDYFKAFYTERLDKVHYNRYTYKPFLHFATH